MAKTKPINQPKQLSSKQRIAALEQSLYNLNTIVGLYVDFNKDTKGFNRFLEEKTKQMAELRKKEEESKEG